MAFSRKQGRVLCFCTEFDRENGTGRSETVEDASFAVCLQEQREGAVESTAGAESKDLCVSLPPSCSVSASSTVGTREFHSSRPLFSRLLNSLQRPTPARRASCAVGGGCRVPLPMYCFNRESMEQGGVEEVEEVVVEPVAEGDGGKNAVPLEAEFVEGDGVRSGNSGRKPDEVSLNLGMGVGMVFLLARSATELNKMVELREQMEVLLKDIKDEFRKKDTCPSYGYAGSNNVVSCASNSCGNENTKHHSSFQNDTGVYHYESVHASLEPHVQSKCATPKRSKSCLKMNQMEAELEIELERLQLTMAKKISSMPQNQGNTKLTPGDADHLVSFSTSFREVYEINKEASRNHHGVSARELERRLNQLLEERQLEGIAELESSFNCTDQDIVNPFESFSETAEEQDEANEEASSGSAHYGVSARELERRLHELLETRQQERITELESALECAERKLREKEREICWWRDTAKLVSDHRDEELYR